mmetsp:Transcript_28543/g.20626  ORF Transcript_28543/g.20626 Transcript_28543/m.20626 type:complete len:89 (+) Transcript_28543:677-943(+)
MLSPFETYIALIKGYCAMTILMLPKAFANGGWMASSIFLVVSGIVTTMCAIKLAESGLKLGIYSYSLIVEKTFGNVGKILLEIMIVLT